MPESLHYIVWFSDPESSDVAQLGGKNASLGEMTRNMRHAGIAVPEGFAITAAAYWAFLDANRSQAEDRRTPWEFKEKGDHTCSCRQVDTRDDCHGEVSRGNGRRDRKGVPAAIVQRGGAKIWTSPSGAARPPRTCPTRVSRASMRPTSMCGANAICSMPAGAVSPRSSRIARSFIGKTTTSST